MKTNKWLIMGVAAIVAVVGWGMIGRKAPSEKTAKVIYPRIEDIQITVTTPGTVLPKNRLEVKPPVNGRIEQVLVREGQRVKAGEILAWMSSTERAALLDAARGEGEEKVKYWQEVYKPIPLIAPIDGEVIVGIVQPGQTVTTAEAVLVLSDRLIVRAQVDETDIGKIQNGQKAILSLDAYPDDKIAAGVDHIYYESKTVNNVTIYEVDLLPEQVPPFFRSGMNANVDFIQNSKANALVVPAAAVHKEHGEIFVMVKNGGGKPEQRTVTVGLANDKQVEILSGLTEKDQVVVSERKYVPPQSTAGNNPLMPQRRR